MKSFVSLNGEGGAVIKWETGTELNVVGFKVHRSGKIDGEYKPVKDEIDNWKPHESEVDYAPITPGRHDIRVEYAQVGGWTELRLDIVRGAPRSKGSPGPH
jgi:hypothetical protein